MSIGKTTGLSSSAATLVIPGQYMKLLTMQNNGASDVRLSFDGGSTYTPQSPGSGSSAAKTKGTDPTTTTGYLWKAGTEIDITSMQLQAGFNAPIVGIMVTGSTTLDFTTDDIQTTFPTA